METEQQANFLDIWIYCPESHKYCPEPISPIKKRTALSGPLHRTYSILRHAPCSVRIRRRLIRAAPGFLLHIRGILS